MTTCADAIDANLIVLKMNRDQKLEYFAKLDVAYNNWQKARLDEQQLYNQIDGSMDIGHYLVRNNQAYINAGIPAHWVNAVLGDPNFWMNHVVYDKILRNCPGGGYKGCCGDGNTDIVDRKCCALGKNRECNPCFNDCGNWGGTAADRDNEYGADDRLNDNLFKAQIEAHVRENTQNLYNIYNSMKEPEPLPGFNIACCQDINILNEAMDESNIIFDTVTNQCTVNNDDVFVPFPNINNTGIPGSGSGSGNTNTNTETGTNDSISSKILGAFAGFNTEYLSPEAQEKRPEKFYGSTIGLSLGIALVLVAIFFAIRAIVNKYKQSQQSNQSNQPNQYQSVQFGSKKNKKRH